jgi:biopolymer transport protein ExbB/TolQ
MDTQEIKSLVIPLMVALDLTVLGLLVAVLLGLAWD